VVQMSNLLVKVVLYFGLACDSCTLFTSQQLVYYILSNLNLSLIETNCQRQKVKTTGKGIIILKLSVKAGHIVSSSFKHLQNDQMIKVRDATVKCHLCVCDCLPYNAFSPCLNRMKWKLSVMNYYEDEATTKHIII
jgi:hypothetical protein